MSVAVPGEVAGYWAAKQRFGNKDITWRRLIQPTIDMAREGITVSSTKAEKLKVYNFTQLKGSRHLIIGKNLDFSIKGRGVSRVQTFLFFWQNK